MFLVIATGALAGDKQTIQFSGAVVDGLDRPVSSATIRLFNGHMGVSEFEIDADTNLVTDSFGRFSGGIPGEVGTTYRVVSKDGYVEIKQTGDWKTNEVIRVLRTAGLTTNDVEAIPSLAPAAQETTVFEFLGSDGPLHSGGLPLACFIRDDVFRPILLKAMQHSSKHASSRAKELLAGIGHPDDLPWSSKMVQDAYGERRNLYSIFLPAQPIKGETLEEAVQHASQGMLEELDKGEPHTGAPTFNKARDRAIVSWEVYTGPKNARGYTLYFTRTDGKWVFTHYIIGWIS